MANPNGGNANATPIDTHDINSVAGATYFVVGRGTEGGPSSFHLSIAGVTTNRSEPDWGIVGSVRDNSGYSLGTIQVDFGQRGTWALGAVTGAPVKSGQTTYVDAVIDQSAKYAQEHGLKFSQDKEKLRSDLLSHGDGQRFIGEGKHRKADPQTPLRYIDEGTRDSINAWASSSEGQQWIHKNIDFPQVKNASQSAMDILDQHGKHIPEDRRLETIAILAKTENQMPGQLRKLEGVLKAGGGYDAVLAKATEIKNKYSAYDGPKAAEIAERYKNAFKDPGKAAALNRAQTKVSDGNFDPSKSANDPDINVALKAIDREGRQRSAKGRGPAVIELQTKLGLLGYTGADGKPLQADGSLGPGTKHAVQTFQHDHHLKEDGVAGPATLKAIEAQLKELGTQKQVAPETSSLPLITDKAHPGHPMFSQAQGHLQKINAQHGLPCTPQTDNAAACVAVAGKQAGMTGIDHLALGGTNSDKLIAVQGQPGSAQSKVIDVPTVQALNTPITQSSQAFIEAQQAQHATKQTSQQTQQQTAPALAH